MEPDENFIFATQSPPKTLTNDSDTSSDANIGPEGTTDRHIKEKESSKSFNNNKGKNIGGNNRNIKVNAEMNPGRSRFKLLDDMIEDKAEDTQNHNFNRALPNKTNVLTKITNLEGSIKKTAARHLNKGGGNMPLNGTSDTRNKGNARKA
ncbi:hypothetical protein ACOSQ3_007182 [Xanthoceras sorbifolium]